MPLTPQDVRAKLFTSVRFKHGYDEDEVDAFLDQVEGDLGVLYGQIDGLKAELAAAQTRLERAEQAPPPPVLEPDTAAFAAVDEVPPSLTGHLAEPSAAAEPTVDEPTVDEPAERAAETVVEVPPAVDAAWAAPAEGAEAASDADESPAATSAAASVEVAVPAGSAVAPAEDSPTEEMLRRTLIIAQRTADALISEAREEAEALVADARSHAEQIERNAAAEHSARQRDRQAEHDHLNGLVEQLRSFENEYRGRLRAYLHLQLRDLESSTPAEPQQQLGSNGQQAALHGGTADEPAAPGAAMPNGQF